VKPITLHPHEIHRLLSHGSVLVVRPVKPQPVQLDTGLWYWQPPRLPQRAPEFVWADALDTPWWIIAIHAGDCPLGAPGTKHWARETWAACFHPEDPVQPGMAMCVEDGKVVGPPRWHPDLPREMRREMFRQWTIRSPVTMPRWASRCDVTVRDVRVMRVQELGNDDLALALDAPVTWPGPGPEPYQRQLDRAFAVTWDARYGKQYPYATNPYVWAVTVARTPDSPAEENYHAVD